MIALTKHDAPECLKRHSTAWTDDLMARVDEYGSFLSIPNEIVQPLKQYKHPDIKAALFEETTGKCAYCERDVPEELRDVEHFLPKPAYPEQSFVWQNLLAACRDCNAAKANVDVGKYPIIQPFREDPETQLSFRGLLMVPKQGGDQRLAHHTIELLQLNRDPLLRERADHLLSLSVMARALSELRHEGDTRALAEVVRRAHATREAEGLHAAFARHYWQDEPLLMEAEALL